MAQDENNPSPPRDEPPETLSCPICLSSSEDNNPSTQFAKTKCGHVFCTLCVQQVLSRTRPILRHDGEEEDIRLTCATRGICPMCRRNISLFDMCNVVDPESFSFERNTNMASWPVADHRYEQRLLARRMSSSAQKLLLDELAQKEGPMNGFGITFQFGGNVPSVFFSTPICSYNRGDGDPILMSSLTFDHFHFHQATMTFHGTITNTRPLTLRKTQKEPSSQRTYCPDYFYQNLDCVLQFSPDGRYIRDGYLSWSYFDPSSPEFFPLDGTWEVIKDYGGIKIHVQFHSFSFLNKRYHILINEDHQAWFRWPDSSIEQMTEEQIAPNGPCIGDSLHWSTSAAGCSQWRRLSMNLEGVCNVVMMKPLSTRSSLVLGTRFVYQRVNADSGNDPTVGPTYHADTLWGNTFCQTFTIGLASYHFLKPDENTDGYQAYISYENPKSTEWPNLDNGEPIPSRVPFRNIQWNEQTRTFKGDILWMEDHGTTWTGDSKWIYEMTFDLSYKFITSGTCTHACTTSNSEPDKFGVDLVYINAAVEDVFRDALDSNTGEYMNILQECRQNGASEATIQYLGEVAMSVMHNGGESYFDFNL